MHCSGRTLVLAALATWLPAQTYYLPAGSATAPGNAVMNAPFTVLTGQPTQATRCMVVLDPSALPFPVGTVLSQLALRRDRSYGTQAYPAITGNLTVKIGRATMVPDQVDDVRFARLWDGVPTMVYATASGSSFTVPAATAPGTTLPPFQVLIPFTKTFTWTGGPLAIEFLWKPAAGSSPWRIDAFANAVAANGSTRLAGSGCPGSNGYTPFHYALPETTRPGASLTLQVEGGRRPASPLALENIAFHLLGLQNTTYQGGPLPVSLATVGGLPACFLRMDPLITTTVATSNPSALFARATSRITLPASPGLVGVNLYSQWILYDGAVAAALPLVASDALRIVLGQVVPPVATHRARTLWKYGATGFDNDGGRLVREDYGPVLRFN